MSAHIAVALFAIQKIVKKGKLTPQEKTQVFTFMWFLAKDFFSTLNINESELGAIWMEISSLCNVYISQQPDALGQEEVLDLFQDDQVHPSVSSVSCRIFESPSVDTTLQKQRDSLKVVRRRPQSSQSKTWKACAQL